jgi:hypothetical protein
MTTKVNVHMSLCNFIAEIEAIAQDEMNYEIRVKSPCERVQDFAKGLETLTLIDITDWPNSKVQRRMLEMKLGASCLVPSGIMNAARLEAGLISRSLAEEVKCISIEFVF